MKYPKLKFALSGTMVTLIVLVFLLIGSCGRGRNTSEVLAPQESVRGSPSVETEDRKLPSLDQILAELDALEKPLKADPMVWGSIKTKLRELLTTRYGQSKSVTKYVPNYDPEHPDLTSASKDYVKPRNLQWESGGTYGRLVWTYVNDGDYNESGQVTIEDIVPLAEHMWEEVTREDSIQELIDEDDGYESPPSYVDGNSLIEFFEGFEVPDRFSVTNGVK